MLKSLIGFVLAAMFAIIGPAAGQESDASTLGSKPWFLLSGTERTDKFAELRLKRSGVIKEISDLDGAIREQKKEIDNLNKTIEQNTAQMSLSNPYYSYMSEQFKYDLEKAEHDKRLEQESYEGYVGRNNKELSRIKATTVSEPINNQSKKPEEIQSNLDAAKLTHESKVEEFDFAISQLRQRMHDARATESSILAFNKKREADIKKTIDESQAAIKTTAQSLSDNVVLVNSLYSSLDKIDSEIMGLIDVGDRDGYFKIFISISFAILVSVVIIGFYRVASQDNVIVKEIFSNDSGIQFITIFSIIIAVILFGIIGVLEGKELSALLGGLSGFILGRGTSASRAGTPTAGGQGGAGGTPAAGDAGGAPAHG